MYIFMKNIYEILKSIGIDVPEEKKEEFDKAVAENYKTVKELENVKAKLTKAEEERDSCKAKYDEDIATRDSDLAELKQKLEDAGVDKSKLEDLTTKLNDLQTTYDNAKTDYEKKLAAQQYEFLVRDSVGALKFSSNSAKKAFIADLTAKNLPVENDKLLGFDDFVNAYKEQDAGAFVVDDNSADNNNDKPQFVSKSGHNDSDNNNSGDAPKVVKPAIW